MSIFRTSPSLPGVYGQIFTEAAANRNFDASVIGLVGPANGGAMNEITTLVDAESARRTLGLTTALDIFLNMQANGGGTVKFVRIGATSAFDEVWMDNASTSGTDVTSELSRIYGNLYLFDTGSTDWLYVGKETPFDSVDFTIVNGASFASGTVVMTAEYYNGSTWSNLTLTDGTADGTLTLQQTGNVDFTEPADWEPTIAPVTGQVPQNLYWVRLRPSEAPVAAGSPFVSMVVYARNATPAYGLISEDASFDSTVTGESGSPNTTLLDTGVDFTSEGVQVGDRVYNLTDGSSATVVSWTDNTSLITTGLTGGLYNKFLNGGSETGTEQVQGVISVADARTIDSVAVNGSNTIIVDSGANFISSRVSVGDRIYVDYDGSTGQGKTAYPVVAVLSENSIEVTGDVNGDFTGDEVGSDYVVVSAKVFRVMDGGAATPLADGLRPGDIITLEDVSNDTATAVVVAVIDDEYVITDGIVGTSLDEGQYFDETYDYSWTVAADDYRIVTPVEKAYLEAKEFGTSGNSIYVGIAQSGSNIVVTLEQDGYIETYKIPTSDAEPLLNLITQINENSLIVTIEDLTGGTYELPTAMATTAFSGGNNGSATTADYIEGLNKLLEAEDVSIVMTVESSDAINAALKSHVGIAESINYQLPRQAFCAKPEDESFLRVNEALRSEAAALAYNGRVHYVVQKATVGSAVSSTGLTTSRVMMAAACAGLQAGLAPATPMTNKPLNIVALDKNFNRSERTDLVDYGILIAKSDSNGLVIERGVTCTTGEVYYESSVRRAVDITELTIRRKLAADYIGGTDAPGILDDIRATVEGQLNRMLKVPAGAGTVRNWRNVVVSYDDNDPTRINVTYEILPVNPLNFIFVTVYVHSGVSFEL